MFLYYWSMLYIEFLFTAYVQINFSGYHVGLLDESGFKPWVESHEISAMYYAIPYDICY